MSPPAWWCWTEQTHPWLHRSSASSAAKSQLIGRYRVLDAHTAMGGRFGYRARDFAPRRLSRRPAIVTRRLAKSPRQVDMCRTITEKSSRPSRSMLGLSGNQSFHTEAAYRTRGGASCANYPQHLPAPFTGGGRVLRVVWFITV